jgi:hypothetical protein
MSDLAVAAQSVAELARFAEPRDHQKSTADRAAAAEEARPKPVSDTAEGVGQKVDIAA